MTRSGLLSLALHAAVITGLYAWANHREAVSDSDDLGAVELVLVQTQGSGVTSAPREPTPQVATPVPPQPPDPQASKPPEPTTQAEEELPLPPPPPPAPSAPPSLQASASKPPPAQSAVQRAQEAPEINLGGTDGETNAIAFGPRVIPASVDAKFHNKEPVYPPEAVRRAQQGAVILLIHVSPEGLAGSVDIARSSGFVLLDRAAQEAVSGWHFLPAVKDGQPVPFDMALRVVFHLD